MKRNLPVSKFSNNSYPDAEKGEHGKEKRYGQSGDETNFNWLLVESKRPVTVAAP